MTLRIGDHVSLTSTNDTSTNYGFIIRINDNTIEVKLIQQSTDYFTTITVPDI